MKTKNEQRAEELRAQMIEAIVDACARGETPEVRELCRVTGCTTPRFYRHWTGIEALQRDAAIDAVRRYHTGQKLGLGRARVLLIALGAGADLEFHRDLIGDAAHDAVSAALDYASPYEQ